MTRSRTRLVIWSAVAGAVLGFVVGESTAESIFPQMHYKSDEGVIQRPRALNYVRSCVVLGAIAAPLFVTKYARWMNFGESP